MRSFIIFLLALTSTLYINAQNTQNDVFKWAKPITGGYNDSKKIAIDAAGNVYTIGSFSGTASFDPGVSASNLTSVNSLLHPYYSDIYLRKSDAHGNFLWVKSIGGPDGSGYGVDLALDAAGNVFLTGGFFGTLDFDPGSDFYGLTSTYREYIGGGGTFTQDVFICKLDTDGNFIWAKSMGGKSSDYVNGIHVDVNGNVLTTGYFTGGTADFNPGLAKDTLIGGTETQISKKIFISKLNANGEFVWVKSIEGINDVFTAGKDIITDDDGNVYTAGSYSNYTSSNGVDFDPGPSTVNNHGSSGGRDNGFILKLDSNGNYSWHRILGADKDDCINALAIDRHNVYLTGYFTNSLNSFSISYFPEVISMPVNEIHYGSTAMFVVKLTSEGAFSWAKAIGEKINAQYPYPDSTIYYPDGTYDVIPIREYTAGVVDGTGIASDGSGNVYTTGYFSDTVDFDPGPNTSFLVSKRSRYNDGLTNCFISKLDSLGNNVWAKSIGGKANDYSYDIAIDSYNNLYTTGTFGDTVDFNPGTDTFNLIGSGYTSFITKIGTPCNSSSSITRVSLCSNELPYLWNGKNYTAKGTFYYIGTNVEGCDSTATLVLNVSSSRPPAPTYIRQVLVDNTCGARIYRYTASDVLNASGYAWTLPTSVGGVAGVVVDSGDITKDRVVRLKYSSNAAAISGDSIKVRAWTICGGDSSPIYKAQLLNSVLRTPSAPYTITITPVQPSVCGSKIYRYAAPVLTSTLIAGSVYNAPVTGYFWSFTNTDLGNNAVIDSGDVNSRIIVVRYTSLAAANEDSVRVAYTSLCGIGANKSVKLTNTGTIAPLAPASLTITPIITNTCGRKIYRFTAPQLTATQISGSLYNAPLTGYVWSFTNTDLGNNAVIDSGNVNSRIIKVSFTSLSAAADGDSVRVAYTSSCGTSPNRSVKLTNGITIAPQAPASIRITPLVTNVCGNQVYRYEAPLLSTSQISGSVSLSPVTGYVWSFTNTDLGNNAVIDSGNVNSRIIVVRFTSLAAAATGDSVRVAYTSSCGTSPNRSAKLTNIVVKSPAAPASITITPVITNVCDSITYRYSAPALPSGNSTTAAATGYVWSFTPTVIGNSAVIDSGNINSRVIVVRFTINSQAQRDSVKLIYTSSCGNSPAKAMRLTNTTVRPSTPTGFSVTKIPDLYCGYSRYRLVAPELPSAGPSTLAATEYRWYFRTECFYSLNDYSSGSTNVIIDSGSLSSRVLNVSIVNNNNLNNCNQRIYFFYLSACNQSNGSPEFELGQNKYSSELPSAPSTISITAVNANACGQRVYRYTAPVLPAATTTKAAATGYNWILPTGNVGATGSLDSGSLSGRVIRIKYTSNAAAAAGDSIRVGYTSICGYSAVKAQKLTNTALVCPQTTPSVIYTKNTVTKLNENLSIEVYPNPSNSSFNIKVNTSGEEKIVMNLLDISGRKLQTRPVTSNKSEPFGEELKPGVYILELRQGNERRVKRLVKLK